MISNLNEDAKNLEISKSQIAHLKRVLEDTKSESREKVQYLEEKGQFVRSLSLIPNS